MSAEPLDAPGTRSGATQAEVLLLCPYGGITHDFRAIQDGNAATVDLSAIISGRKILIRLAPVRQTIRPDGQMRESLYHFGDANWWEIDADGDPLGLPNGGNGYLNLQVTAHDTVIGVIRT